MQLLIEALGLYTFYLEKLAQIRRALCKRAHLAAFKSKHQSVNNFPMHAGP